MLNSSNCKCLAQVVDDSNHWTPSTSCKVQFSSGHAAPLNKTTLITANGRLTVCKWIELEGMRKGMEWKLHHESAEVASVKSTSIRKQNRGEVVLHQWLTYSIQTVFSSELSYCVHGVIATTTDRSASAYNYTEYKVQFWYLTKANAHLVGMPTFGWICGASMEANLDHNLLVLQKDCNLAINQSSGGQQQLLVGYVCG